MYKKLDSIQSKLTPAAQDALDELIIDIREQLLLNSEKIAYNASGEVREITVRDIVRSFELLRMKSEEKNTEQYYYYIFAGMLALFIFSFLLFADSLYEFWIFPYMLAVVSFSISFMLYSKSKQKIRKARRDWELRDVTNHPDYSMVLVKEWQEFELELRLFIATNFGESQANIPISKSIGLLSERKIISLSDEADLLNALKSRNLVLHEGISISSEKVSQTVEILENITKKIKIRSY